MSPSTEQVGVQSNSIVDHFFLEAKKLNDAKWIYGLYGAMDGLSTSFSMLKYFFDMYCTSSGSSSSDVLHDWSLTPLGAAFMSLEAVALVGCSVIGNTADDDGYAFHSMSIDNAKQLNHTNCFIWDETQLVYLSPDGIETILKKDETLVQLGQLKKTISIKQANGLMAANGGALIKSSPTPSVTGSIASHWPYARDVMKAMKNTYKGIRNTFVLTDLLVVGREYHYLVVPVGLGFGALAAYNRTWLRKIRDERKDAKKVNIELQDKLHSSLSQKNAMFSLSDWDFLRNTVAKEHDDIRIKIQPPSHSQFFWLYAQLSGAFSGLIDAPYLYFGALSLTVALPSSLFFIFVATASLMFAVTCVATRIYEEKIFQRELLASQLDVELAMSIREIKLLRDNLSAINAALSNIDVGAQDLNELDLQRTQLTLAWKKKWAESQLIQKDLFEQSHSTLGFIIMSGLKNGLDAYGAMASLMFFIATINLVILVPCSQFLVLGFVTAGLAGLLICPALALMRHYYPPQQNTNEAVSCLKKPSTLELFSELEQDIEGADNTRKSPSTPVIFDGVLEIARGACSGAGKGVRGIEQILVAAQEQGADGHYHDTDSMFIFATINAILFAITFGLRGFARLGRGISVAKKPKNSEMVTDAVVDTETEVIIETTQNVNDKVDESTLLIATSLPAKQDPFPSPMTITGITNMSQENICELNDNSFFKQRTSITAKTSLLTVLEFGQSYMQKHVCSLSK